MINTILITGCTQGLGQALVLKFSQIGCCVYAVGRNELALKELSRTSEFIRPIVADIATVQGRHTITKHINTKVPLSIIHNAAIVKPAQFDNLSESLLREHVETNLLAPILITQQLISLLGKGQRILNISSGAASIPLAGLMPYCTTKSALEFVTRCLNVELNSRGIYCANLRPGMINTRMQLNLRNADENALPNREYYICAENKNTLIQPEVVAEFIAWVLMKTKDDTFAETLWNIYDTAHHDAWLLRAGYAHLLSVKNKQI